MTDVQPFKANIMSIVKFNYSVANVTHKRFVKNYELDFYISGERKMSVNKESFNVGNGTMVFRRPGDYVISTGSYNCYCLTLDFSLKKTEYCKNYDRNNSDDAIQESSSNPLLNLIPSHFNSHYTADYIKIMDRLYNACQTANGDDVCGLLLNQLFCLILSEIYHNKALDNSNENSVLVSASKYIQENFQNPISIKQLADKLSLSPSYFIKMFKKAFNTTPTEYIISIRFSYAKQLLSESDLPIVQIAAMCGFNNASYFSYYFKKVLGISPKEYRKKNR